MTPADIATITRVMGPVIREFTAKAVVDATAPLLARNAALELRLLDLETHPSPVAVGPVGQKGDTGAGIASLVVSAEGRLLVHLTDGRSLDAGPVPRGQQGDIGARGDAGPVGSSGPAGERGERGEKGEPGIVGSLGPQGERGLPGAQGERGLVGEKGESGVRGDVGSLGPQGQPGDLGETGLDGKDGAPGLAGKDGAPGLNGKDGAVGLAGKDGTPGLNGKDGTSVDLHAIAAQIDARLTKAIAAIPVPKDGQDGVPGADGRSITVDDVAPFIAGEIEKRIAVLPVPKDGIGFTGAVISRDGHLVLTLSNGTTQDVGPVIGKDGVSGLDGKDAVGTPGKDGLDGLGFDDFDLSLDETRGWILRLSQGERVKEWALGIPFDKKIWEAGTVYPKGAGVTHDGGYWIALTQTSDQPGEGCPAWRLAVRRGKQGREGKQGKDGSAGRDLTQIDPGTGRKW